MPGTILGTQQIRMIKIKGKEESQYYATANSGIGSIFHMIYPHMCMTKDAVNLIHRRVEAMAGGFISGPIMSKITDYRKLLQKGKSAKIRVSFHEVCRKVRCEYKAAYLQHTQLLQSSLNRRIQNIQMMPSGKWI